MAEAKDNYTMMHSKEYRNQITPLEKYAGTMGRAWMKSLVDGVEELKKDLRKDVKKLPKHYVEDVGATTVAVVNIKAKAQKMVEEMGEMQTNAQETVEKMGEMQKVIDGLVAAEELGRLNRNGSELLLLSIAQTSRSDPEYVRTTTPQAWMRRTKASSKQRGRGRGS